MANPPLPYIWRDGAMHPANARAMREAASRYGEGEVVTLDDERPRSRTSHDHFFAVVGEAHASLPEGLEARFPTADSLRHHALIRGGYCDVETFVAGSKAEALRLAGFIRAGSKDGVEIAVNGATVTRLTPHSQSKKAMGAQVFQESKARCLEIIADLLDVTPAALGRAA